MEIAKVVNDLAVVNDTAERGVKDLEYYANQATDGAKEKTWCLFRTLIAEKFQNSRRMKWKNEF